MRTTAVCYILKGSCTITINEQVYEASPGACFLLEPGLLVGAEVSDGGPIDIYWVAYAGASLHDGKVQSSGPLVAYSRHIQLHLSHRTASEAVLKQLEQTRYSPHDVHYFRKQALFYEFLHLILTNPRDSNHEANQAIQHTLRYMERHYLDWPDLAVLPKLAGMTPSSFCRAFKKATGRTPGDYMTLLRIRHAKELLVQSPRSMKDVARSIGFKDPLYFSRLFKKIEGVAPTIYMKQTGQRIAVVSKLFLQDHLLALGIQPVAAPSYPGGCSRASSFPIYLRQRLRGTKPLNAMRAIDPSEIMELSPDLIIKMNFRHNRDDRLWLGNTAHTVLFDGFEDWRDYQRKIAGMVCKEDEAEAVIRHISRAERQGRDALRDFTRSGKWTILRVHGDEMRVHGSSGHAVNDLFYEGLGFRPDDSITHSFYRSLTMQELIEYEPERILILWSKREEVAAAAENPLWRQLPAVVNKQVYIPDSAEWDPWGPLGREHMIRSCVSYFKELALLPQ